MTEARKQAERLGRLAEALAALALRLKGYRVLHRRWRCHLGEIDLVVRRGNAVAFVEVKARPDRDSAAMAVTGRQRRRIARAVAAYLAANGHLAALSLRYDVVLVTPWRWPRHIADAWR